MKLSDAFRFSKVRRAIMLPQHAKSTGSAAVVASDYGIRFIKGFQTYVDLKVDYEEEEEVFYHDADDTITSVSWSGLTPEFRSFLLRSDAWAPLRQKPTIEILAEAVRSADSGEIDDQHTDAPDTGDMWDPFVP